MALFALILGSASVHAGEADTRSVAVDKLQSDLHTQLRGVCLDGIMERNTCEVTLVFRVNDQSELTDFTVTGENMEMVRRVEDVLAEEVIVADPALANGKYRVTVCFKNARTIF